MLKTRSIKTTKVKTSIPAFGGTRSLHLLQTSKVMLIPTINIYILRFTSGG